jgi:formylglycine-generating enzyme required for sulfatase activity
MIQDIEEVPASDSHRTDLQFFKGWIYFKSRQPEKSKHSLQIYLQREENGPFSKQARDILKILVHGEVQDIVFPNKKTSLEKTEGMALVSAGFFIMGSNTSLQDEAPEHRVYLDSYWIDKFEVSAEKFAKFLNTVENGKKYYLDNKFGTLNYDGHFYRPRPGLENYPINNVNWHAANAYCKWQRKRLPTEAEWEKGARDTSLIYPWGNASPSADRARYLQTWAKKEKHQVMVPVQALPEGQSPYGLYNMAGNVKEWVDDWYDREYYKEQSEYANPRGPIGGEFKAIRGGSWRDLKGFIYSSFRNNGSPGSRMDDYGFRCAKNADPTSGEKKLTSRVAPRNNG